jgi:hypothetical protein
VIAEAAFYAALDWQRRISNHLLNPVTYPLETNHKLWCFTIDPPPAIIDLEHAQAIAQFQHTPHMLLNLCYNPANLPYVPGQPLARDYFGTQRLAKYVRGHIPPHGSPYPRPEGVKAPAIRLKRFSAYRPHQFALFVFSPAVHQPYDARSRLVTECELQLRFQQLNPRGPVTVQTVEIDWCAPQFRMSGGGAAVVPAFALRPGAIPFNPNRWYNCPIRFA